MTDNNNYNNKSEFLTCKDCKLEFEDMDESQRHIVAEHLEKGDFPKEEEVE
jgi:hypothetical protein